MDFYWFRLEIWYIPDRSKHVFSWILEANIGTHRNITQRKHDGTIWYFYKDCQYNDVIIHIFGCSPIHLLHACFPWSNLFLLTSCARIFSGYASKVFDFLHEMHSFFTFFAMHALSQSTFGWFRFCLVSMHSVHQWRSCIILRNFATVLRALSG